MNWLKELREDALLTVRELSERSGVSEDTITKIENSHRKGRSMTIRKLAKALGVTPLQLSPQQFDHEASEFIFQENLVKPETASTSVSEAAASKVVEFEDRISYVRSIVEAVRTQCGLGARWGLGAHDYLKHLTEEQRNVLLIVARNGAMSPSEVARQVAGDISVATRDLAILGEYGLVSSNESGESRATPLGAGAADILSEGGLHYDAALEHISTLMKAYESTLVFGDRPRRVDVLEAARFVQLQDAVVQTIRHILKVAEPAPEALTVVQAAVRVVHERTSSTTDDHVDHKTTERANHLDSLRE